MHAAKKYHIVVFLKRKNEARISTVLRNILADMKLIAFYKDQEFQTRERTDDRQQRTCLGTPLDILSAAGLDDTVYLS